MFEKSKNDVYNPRKKIVWISIVLLTALAAGAVGYNLKPSTMSVSPAPTIPVPAIPVSGETVILPLNRNEPILTSGMYQGIVVMVVSGTGQADSGQFNDAFYTFASSEGVYDDTPELQFQSGLELDGQLAFNIVQANGDGLFYAHTHTYLIRYDAGSTPRPIALSLSGDGMNNSGQFQITIFSGVNWSGTVASFVPPPIP